ncbi:hypothetical protein B484DRAFT_400085 [Ochromonadaceae sp. CCMP2298]|nr:hypothetical protein B484DRAFT_400085 [Ochromonadaceae sp. CCMP2298]
MDKKDKPQRRAKQQQETAEKKLTTPAKKPAAAGAKRINFDPAMMPNLPGGRDKLVPRLRSRKRQLRPDHQALRQRKLSDYNSRMEDWNGTTVSKRVGTKPRYEESKRSLHCYCHNNNQPDDGSCPRCIADAKAGRPVNHETCDICECNCGIGYAASDHPRIASEKQMMAANTTMSVAVVVSACVMDTMGTVGMFVIEYFNQVQQNVLAYGKGYDHSATINPFGHHPNILRNTSLQNENAYSYAGGWEDAGAGGWQDAGAGGWQDAGGLLTADTSGHNGSSSGGWEDAGASGWQDPSGLLTADTSSHNGSSSNSSSVGVGQQDAAAQDAAIVSALASHVRKRAFKHSAADGIAPAEEAKLDKIINVLTDPDDRTSKKLKSWMVDDSQVFAVALKQAMKDM